MPEASRETPKSHPHPSHHNGTECDVPKVATGFVANVVCTETFVSGLDPARVFAETTSAMPGASLIAWALDYRVDRVRKDVTVTLFGIGKSHAVYRGEVL